MDSEEWQESLSQLLESFEVIRRELLRRNKLAYERWKAGGYLISADIISNYPCVEDVVTPIIEELRQEEQAAEAEEEAEAESAS